MDNFKKMIILGLFSKLIFLFLSLYNINTCLNTLSLLYTLTHTHTYPVYSQVTTSNLPEITTHPQGGVYKSTTQIVLTCGATNPVSIQWTHNNVLLSSGDVRISSSTTLTISGLTAETSGSYVCLATNDAGTVASMEAVLTLAGTF